MIALEPLGDRAWLATFDDEPGAAAWGNAVRHQAPASMVDLVVAYRSVAVHYDPLHPQARSLEADLRALAPRSTESTASRFLRVPVLYDGPDLAAVANSLGLSPDQVIQLHAEPVYQVFAVGFLPGFPYAGYLPNALQGLPRLESPRPRVPAGSVAITGRQTGIYPVESPGGWRLLGRTPVCIASLADAYFAFQPGDRIQFQPISTEHFQAMHGSKLSESS